MKKLFFSALVLLFLSVMAEASHSEVSQAVFCQREFNLERALLSINTILGKPGTKVKLDELHEIVVGSISAPTVAFNDGKYTVCVTITSPKTSPEASLKASPED